MKDRTAHPIEFLERIRKNFNGVIAENSEADALTSTLLELVKSSDKTGIHSWIRKLSNDPEQHGSAFYSVYNFARDYLEKLDAADDFGVPKTLSGSDPTGV